MLLWWSLTIQRHFPVSWKLLPFLLWPWASLGAQSVKSLPASRKPGFDYWFGKIPWRRKWQPSPAFLSGESHGQRSLEGYSPQGRESRTRLKWLSTAHMQSMDRTQSSHPALLLFTLLHSWSLENVCFRHRIITGPFLKAVCTTCTWLEMSIDYVCGIFPTQGSDPGLPHCRQIIYQLSHKRSLRILEWVAYPFSRGSSQPRNWTGVPWNIGGFLTNRAIREAHIAL